MTSCSTAILSAKNILRTYRIEIFTCTFAGKIASKWWLWSGMEVRNVTNNKFLNLTIQWKYGICRLKSEHNHSEKRRQKCTFDEWWFKSKGHKNIKLFTLGCCFSLSKFLATRLCWTVSQLRFKSRLVHCCFLSIHHESTVEACEAVSNLIETAPLTHFRRKCF